jgi:dTDP-4-amino-4,6-dideoxygalactose transaminase
VNSVPFVDLAAQHREIAEEVEAGFAEVMASTSFIQGKPVAAFEVEYAAYLGVGHCVGVGNGTDALEIALRALGVGAGDEVIIPANTFVATAEAVVRAGAVPVLVDCRADTLLIDPELVAAAVGPKTRAIMPVHLYGQTAEMELIAPIAEQAGAFVIEDAAQSQGARRFGRAAGSFGDAAGTSFYPGKNLGAYGDAGAVVTDSATVARAARVIANHGSERRYEHELLGVNSRLDTLQAVVLRAKLARLDRWNAARSEAAARYGELLGGIEGLVLPVTADGNEHVWHLYVVQVDERDRVIAELNQEGVGAAVHYPVPVHLHPAFAGLGHGFGSFPVAEAAAGRILSLPMHPHLTPEQQAHVAHVLAGTQRTTH